MRVLLDCRMSAWSGVGRYTRGIVRALARTDGVEIVQVVGHTGEPPVPGAETVHADAHPFSPGGVRQLAHIVRKTVPDVTHCLHFPTPLPVSHPLVVTLHDLSPLLVPGVMVSPWRRYVFRAGVRRALTTADRVIAISSHTASDLRAEVPAAASKLRIVLEAADDFTAGPVVPLPEGLRAKAGERYVLSMGNTRPHKDLPTLLRAFERISASHPDVRLLLVGPDAAGYIESVLDDADVAARVHFTGPVDDDVLRGLYAGAAVFAFPSRYEGFGLPPLEAMGLGAPVVCSDAASLPEVVGDAALTVPAGDVAAMARAMAQVLDDAATAEDLRARGRSRAATFSWDRAARETLAVYKEAISL